jgi:hypothetical protein
VYNTKITYVYVCTFVVHFKLKEFLPNNNCKVFCFCVALRLDDASRDEPKHLAARQNVILVFYCNSKPPMGMCKLKSNFQGFPFLMNEAVKNFMSEISINRLIV